VAEIPVETAASLEGPLEVEQEAAQEEGVSLPSPVHETQEPIEEESKDLPIAEMAAGLAGGAVAAAILVSEDNHEAPAPQVSEKAIVDEPEGLEEVAEEEKSGEPPSPEPNKHRKHRSSRHSKSSSRTLSSREGPSDEGRPYLHRKRRESVNSLKNMFFGAPPVSPKRPSRHDSGVSAGSTSPHTRKHRSDRTPEEQAAHDMRKAARAAASLKAAESGSAVADDLASPEIGSSSVPTRRSSTRRQSSSRSSGARDGEKPKLLDMKGESVIKAKFIATPKPHIKSEIKKSSKVPIIDRPRFSIDGERPKPLERSNSTRYHHSSSSRKAREGNERYKADEDRELRKAREETRREVERARAEVAEESRRRQERDDEERRLRREARRKRREEEEKVGEGNQERQKNHQSSRSGREKEKERERSKSDGPLKSLWSSAKNVFT
jgi:hypothetical protein